MMNRIGSAFWAAIKAVVGFVLFTLFWGVFAPVVVPFCVVAPIAALFGNEWLADRPMAMALWSWTLPYAALRDLWHILGIIEGTHPSETAAMFRELFEIIVRIFGWAINVFSPGAGTELVAELLGRPQICAGVSAT